MRNRVLTDKLLVVQLATKFPVVYDRHIFISSPARILSTLPHPLITAITLSMPRSQLALSFMISHRTVNTVCISHLTNAFYAQNQLTECRANNCSNAVP